jgi:hypothetical protein
MVLALRRERSGRRQPEETYSDPKSEVAYNGKQIVPPSKLITKLGEAASTRNKVVHVGEKAPEYKELVEMLEAIQDFLWICDMYRGQLKNVRASYTG